MLRLANAQALAGANAVVVYATDAIVGDMLAPTPILATLPISIFVVGMAACIFPIGAIARRHGRRAAFLVGTGAGVLTGLLAMLALIMGWFWLFCLATFFGGGYAAVVLSFRFAAADGVEPKRRARALSLVMAGGVAAGVGGWPRPLWCDCPGAWPARRLSGGDRSRCPYRPAGYARADHGVVLAVLSGDLFWRGLCGRGAVVPLRGRRRCGAETACARAFARHGRRRGRRSRGTAIGDLDDASLAPAYVCRHKIGRAHV